jgi:arachidonate 5-lipoxygenase
MKYSDLHLPENLKRRKIPSEEFLPKYYYRDDGMKIWTTIYDFCKNIVDIYYTSDEKVSGDVELNAFAEQVDKLYEGREFPSKFSSRQELADFCTVLIWTFSCQHAVLNYTQYDSFAFIPAVPGSLRQKPPAYDGQEYVKGTITKDYVIQAFPDDDLCIAQIAIVKLLSSYSEEDDMLGQYPECLFVEKEALNAIDAFQKKLREVDDEILKRGDWEWLRPSKVPNSISI